MAIALFFLYVVFSLTVLYRGLKTPVWEIGSLLYLVMGTFFVGFTLVAGLCVWIAIGIIASLIHVEPVRAFLADFIYQRAGKTLPKLSKTEETALNAGDTWLEQDIFRGKPDFKRLSEVQAPLTEEEKAFLANETETLCQMIDEWKVVQDQDMPEPVWQFIKDKGFLGMVIAKEHGGKGFSARAHSDVVMKLASRSIVAAVTVMVPNSLGPGELLHYYGTDEQKKKYLPKLANGTEIPCFALTEPGAGSDATSIESEAVVMKKTIDDKEVLGINITLNKRWITLAPVATLIGLAVNLRDPEGLLQGVGEEGITCVLISRDTPNLEIGNRHIPANQPFMNGTIRGSDIFVPIHQIIGGQKEAGRGWQMLVECLSIGRSISLPALGAASATVSYLTTGAFSRVRRQFAVEIGQFEGVQEKLAEIAGLSWLVNATRMLTLAAVDAHKKPSVASAITKYFNTELSRIAVNNAMDVHAGRTVVVGPRNYMTGFYQGAPISITVEGANIMTRNLLIFGQGSMACHPYVRDEFYAISKEDKKGFTRLLWSHINYFLHNLAKTTLTSFTGGWLISTKGGKLKREQQKLVRLSYAFAWLADFALITLGGDLKRRERLSARLADGLSFLYMAMASIKMADDLGNREDDLVHAKWACAYSFHHAQKSLLALCKNYPIRPVGWLMRLLAFPFGQTMALPTDKMDATLAKLMTKPNSARAMMKELVFIGDDPKEPIARVEHAWSLVIENEDIYHKVNDLRRFKFGRLKEKLKIKVKDGVLTQDEMDKLITTEKARWDAIQVDEFTMESMKKRNFGSVIDKQKCPLS